MNINSEVTIDFKAKIDNLNKTIKAINKSMKIDLGENIEEAIKDSTKALKEGFIQNKPIAEIKELKDKLREATKVKLKFDIEQATNQIKTLGAQFIGTYTTFKGLVSKPISASIDFNNSINEINAFANLGAKELESLKKDIWDLGKNNGVSLEGILKTTELSSQLGVAKNELKDFSQLALNLQVGLKLSSEESVNGLSKISKAFGMNTKDLEIFSDTLTQMGLTTKTSAKAILEVTKSILSGAKAFGLSAKEASALSASFLSVGLDSSEASSSINKFFTELNNIDNATPAFTQALSQMGLDAEQLKEDIQSNPQEAIKNLFADLNDLDDAERFGVISELFGKKMANNINSAKDGIQAFQKALESSKDSAGALQKAVDRVAGDGFGDLVISLGTAFKHLGVSIGNGFVPMLSWGFEKLKVGIEWISDFLDNHKWVATIMAANFSFLVFVKTVGLSIMAIKPLGTIIFYPFQILLKKLMLTNFGLKTSIRLSNLFTIGLKGMKIGLIAVWSGLKNAFWGIVRFNYGLALNSITTKIATVGNNLLKISMMGVNAVSKAVSFSILTLNKSFKIASLGASLFSKIFRISMLSIKGALIGTGIGAVLIGIGFAIEAVYTHWNGIYTKIIGIWQSIKEGISPIIDWFKGVFDWLGDGIKGIIDSIMDIGDFLGLGNGAITHNQTASISYAGLTDEVIAKANENKAKMLSSLQNNQTDNSRQINDYKTITINTNANPQAIASAINSYSYADDEF